MQKYALKLTCFLLLLLLGPVRDIFALEINADIQFARHENSIIARVAYQIPEGYNSYANDSNGLGKPTKLDFVLEDQGAMPVMYPLGVEKPDIFDPAKKGRVYAGNAALYASLPANSEGRLYSASLDMLLCSKRHCMPVKKAFSGQVPQAIPPLKTTGWATQVEEALVDHQNASGQILVEEGALPPPIEGVPAAKQDEKLLEPINPEVDATTPHAVSQIPKESDFPPFDPQYLNEDLEVFSLGKALLFGLFAGLILNIMPCVLPVLTLKVGALMALGNYTNKDRRREFIQHNLFFAAGILTFFTFLAILLGAADGIWGQLYQNHALLLTMLLLVFLMGLSMLGVFTLPTFDLRLGSEVSHPALQSYLTGLVSTFLATPCSGPMLGGVLAWAFTQPLLLLMIIFWSVGLGMALPYIIFAIWPDMARILPRPGDWMLVFERIMGFLLLGTAIYLISILPEAKYLQIMILLLVAAVSAWVWGNFCGLEVSRLRRFVTGGACAAVIVATMLWVLAPVSSNADWQKFSQELFHKDLGASNLLVEFTADWCPNCKYLEATVLTPENLEKWQKKYSLQIIRADLTNENPQAEKLLELLGSKSIPLTALFSKGDSAFTPLVLRDLYDEDTLKKALKATFNKKSG